MVPSMRTGAFVGRDRRSKRKGVGGNAEVDAKLPSFTLIDPPTRGLRVQPMRGCPRPGQELGSAECSPPSIRRVS